MAKRKSSKTSKDKRLHVDVWVTDGLRAAIGELMRDDGKPATDVQVRHWAQERVDQASIDEVDKYEGHKKRRARR